VVSRGATNIIAIAVLFLVLNLALTLMMGKETRFGRDHNPLLRMDTGGKSTMAGKSMGAGKSAALQSGKSSAAGKGQTTQGKASTKRLRKVLRDNLDGITNPAIRRLARRGGVKRISRLVYENTREMLKEFLTKVMRDTITYTEYSKRKTVTAMDVVQALKKQGKTLYGFQN